MKVLVVLFVISVRAAVEGIPLRVNSFSCLGNEKYCDNLSCSIETIRKKMQVFNMEANFPQELETPMIKFTLYKKEGSAYKGFLIDSTEDLCKVLDNAERSSVLSRMMPMWKAYGKFPTACPIKGELYIRRYPLDLSFYPSIFPSGDFQIKIGILEGNLSVLNATTTFSVHYA